MIPENIKDCQKILMHFDCNCCIYKEDNIDCTTRIKFQDEAGIVRKTGLSIDSLVNDMKKEGSE